ncbi:MAG: hypothetical protein WCL71_13720 [Deltaproteobacteria bacterium]
MKLFEQLRRIALQQNEDGEFPTWLLSDILALADKPDRYTDKVHLVKQLIRQIGNFDAYAGAGCFDNSSSAETIGITIRQIVTK